MDETKERSRTMGAEETDGRAAGQEAEKAFEDVLRTVLADDRTLLGRSGALAQALDAHPLDSLQALKERRSLERALQETTIGEKMLAADRGTDAAKEAAVDDALAALQAIRMQDEAALRTVEILADALGWDMEIAEEDDEEEAEDGVPVPSRSEQAQEITELQEQVRLLTATCKELGARVERLESHLPAAAYAASVAEEDTEAPVADPSLFRDFVTAYNRVREQYAALPGGTDSRALRTSFLQDYHVRGIACTNVVQRIKDPKTPLALEEQSLATAAFWAYPLADDSGRYAVVPTFRNYTMLLHQQGGGAEAFASNYHAGGYRNITVIRPAIFASLTEIAQRGRLQLS